MSILSLNNVSKSYGQRLILNGINLQLNAGDHLGLIGHNGTGKTTLLRLISGQEEPDGEIGQIHLASTCVPGYLEQEFTPDEDHQAVLEHPDAPALDARYEAISEALAERPEDSQLLQDLDRLSRRYEASGAYDYAYRLAETAAGLGLDLEKIKRGPATLSGGERMRLKLAGLIVTEADLLLLDEPTNHLDMEAIEWLETYLARSKKTFIVVSHDRAFLDKVCTRIGELNNGKLTCFQGNYSQFKTIQKAQLGYQLAQEAKLRKTIEHEQQVVETLFSHRNISAYHSREKKLAKLNEALDDLKRENRRIEPRFTMQFLDRDAAEADHTLITAKDLTVHFPDSPEALFRPFDISIKAADKIVFCGPNGCGKSNLLAALSAENPYLEGHIQLQRNLRFANLKQWQRFTNPQLSVLDTLFSNVDHISLERAHSTLAAYGFYEDDLNKPAGDLSGGEKSRLSLAALILKNPDLLFLDEPTNHLDTYSSEILENALKDFTGAIVAVSHDRYFIEQVGFQVYGFVGQQIQPFPHYAAYRRACQQAREAAATAEAASGKREVLTSTEGLFSPEELELFPFLKKIPQPGKNRKVQRQIRARLAEAQSLLEKEMQEIELACRALEAQFSNADSGRIFEEYGEKQIQEEKLLALAIKLDDLLEAFSG